MDKRTKDLITLLLGRREINDIGCWLYKGNLFTNGYGQLKYRNKIYSVHRLSLVLFTGTLFKDKGQANHIRECPNKHCFNPEHLYKGTQIDNMKDYFGLVCKTCETIRIPRKKCKVCLKVRNAKFYKHNKSKHW